MPQNWCILLELCFSACRWADGTAENRYWSDLMNECISCVSGCCSVWIHLAGVFTCSIMIRRAWPIDPFNFIHFLLVYWTTDILFGSHPPQIWWSLKLLRRLKPHTRTVSETTARGKGHKQTHLSSSALNTVCQTNLSFVFTLSCQVTEEQSDETRYLGKKTVTFWLHIRTKSKWWWNLENIPHRSCSGRIWWVQHNSLTNTNMGGGSC